MELTGEGLVKLQLHLFSYNREIIRKREEAVRDIATGQVGALARCHEHTFTFKEKHVDFFTKA